MECIPANSILEFKADQLNSVRKQYSLDKPGDMARAIDVLEEWVKVQKHFTKKELPRNYLEKAILAGKGSLERAKQRLDKICTFRTLMPEFFENDPVKNTFGNAHVIQSILLPQPTNEHYRVYIFKVTGSTFTYDMFMECYRCIVMLCEYVMGYDYCNGFMVVIDYTEANLIELIKALTLAEVHNIFTVVTEGFGMRLKGFHIMTSSNAVNKLVTILKQLISTKLGRRIFVHNNASTLYTYIPKDILPVEYGGMEESFKVLHDKLKYEVTGKEFRDYLQQMNDAKTDESCRDRAKFNEQYLGVSGSFRTLNVD